MTDDPPASQIKLLHALKLLYTMLQLAELLEDAGTWQAIECLLVERPGHSLSEDGSVTAEFANNSLLHAIISCYKCHLSPSIRKAKEDMQHLIRVSSKRSYQTKSYEAHVNARHVVEAAADWPGPCPAMIAPLLARVLARLLRPDCLQEAARVMMLGYGLPEDIIAHINEVGFFDHCQVRGQPSM